MANTEGHKTLCKEYRGVKVKLNAFLTSIRSGVKKSAAGFDRYHPPPPRETSGTHYMGSCVVPIASLNEMAKRKVSAPVVQPLASHFTNCTIQVHI
jgi:hypothetical protein